MDMMAMRLYGPNDMRYEKIEAPEPGPNDVRIKVKCCGICGTDEAIYTGETSFYRDGLIRLPMTFGHEYSGVIDAVGENVTKFKLGDRVVSDTCVSCGICDTCLSGHYLQCKDMHSVGTIDCVDGAYAEYTVMPERHVFHLPDSIPFDIGALIEPLATALHAVDRANIDTGETCLITGTGPIGLGAIPFVKARGARTVIVAGRKDFKLGIAKKLGADVVVNMAEEDLASKIDEITGGEGVDSIVEASGSLKILKQSVDMLALNGRLSLVAFYENDLNDFPIDKMVIKNATIECVGGSDNCFPKVIKMLSAGKIDVSCMITHTYPLDKVLDAMADLRKLNDERVKFMIKAD